ncbi:MAG: hypothetical protein SPK28_02500, partial [Bacilli bacterium]|nr:hypothetical protein [Bacilli bacterium]
YNKTNEESIGFTASSGSYSTSKNDEYFLDEVPSFKISILKEIDGKPILDESYRLEVPLTSESYSNFEITYNIVWNIELA